MLIIIKILIKIIMMMMIYIIVGLLMCTARDVDTYTDGQSPISALSRKIIAVYVFI